MILNERHPGIFDNDILYFNNVKGTLPVMAFPVVEFSRQGYKIRKVFG